MTELQSNPNLLFDVLLLPSIIDRKCRICDVGWSFAKISEDHARIMLACKEKHTQVLRIREIEDVTESILSSLDFYNVPKLPAKANDNQRCLSKRWGDAKAEVQRRHQGRDDGSREKRR